MDAQEYVENLSDADLEREYQEANDALAKAAQDEPESEHHQACFAATLIFIYEMAKRGYQMRAPRHMMH